MNKKQLIAEIAKATGMMRKDVEVVVETMLDVITKTLKQGEKVQLVGFGTFEVRRRNARDCKNPQTGEIIHMGENKVPAFKAGKSLKETISILRQRA